jgi:hypothetical protein
MVLLWFGAAAAAAPGRGDGAPPRAEIVTPHLAPEAARLVKHSALRYDPAMSPQDRERDFLAKAAKIKAALDLTRLVDLRHQSLKLLEGRGGEISWETLRLLRWPNGDRVGVTLSVPVWVPSQARRVPAFAGFEKEWRTVAYLLPRPSGFVWFAGSLADINNKARYRPERLQVEVNSRFAPIAALFLEYIFREGWYDQNKRVPLLVVRLGEDTWSAPAYGGPVEAECLSFPDESGDSFNPRVVRGRYASLAEIHHGRHAPASNHRLGLAMDINDFNFKHVVDGNPNPVSLAIRHYNRDAMHRLDARNLPAWVYQAGKWLGFRIPQEWLYTGESTDWPHFDVGTRVRGRKD